MKTLNLVDLEKSDIKYKISKFPDGQQQVTIVGEEESFYNPDGGRDHWWEKRIVPLKTNFIEIKARLNSFLDLELIVCTVASLRGLGVKEIHLYIPYFLGSRSDRKFEEGSNNYLKDAICPIINSLKFDSVTVIDPHSDVLEACLNNFKKVDNLDLVKWVFMNYPQNTKSLENFILISPDAGANKKIFKIAEQIGYKGDVITCSKDRDVDGRLTKTVVPLDREYLDKDFIIIDDICDGGATFINIAKDIKAKGEKYGLNPKIHLVVTHSIFSRGTDELLSYFDGIYTTNSYKEHNNEKIKVLNIF